MLSSGQEGKPNEKKTSIQFQKIGDFGRRPRTSFETRGVRVNANRPQPPQIKDEGCWAATFRDKGGKDRKTRGLE